LIRCFAAMALVVLLLSSGSACYRTVIRDGSPRGDAPVLFEHAWHHGFLFGIGEIPATGYRLDDLCPQGWAEIKVYTSGLNALIAAVLGASAIYSPQTISLHCADRARGVSGEAD
jgi:hypothetical protein